MTTTAELAQSEKGIAWLQRIFSRLLDMDLHTTPEDHEMNWLARNTVVELEIQMHKEAQARRGHETHPR